MENLILQALGKSFDQDFCSKIQFSSVPRGQKGDLALQFFALVKELKKSPIEIANEVAEILNDSDFIQKTEIAGPYLNVFFEPSAFFQKVFDAPLAGSSFKGKTIVLEFSGPNTNKPLHLGHMRNHALGISTSNAMEAAGADVHRVNIINDRGVHICKSMLAYAKFGSGETPESANKKSDHFVGDWYVKFSSEVKKDESLNEEVQEMLVKWEDGDEHVRALWEKMSAWALDGHQKTYKRQGIEFEKSYYESDYYLAGKEIVYAGLEKNIFKKREDGAVIIDLTEEGLDEKVVLRADGTSIYLTQDLAVASGRKKDFNPDQLIYVVGDEQNYHFKVLFWCLEKLGLLDHKECFHLGYGLVNLPDGRMKSREGTVVDADNLMDDLHDLAQKAIEERNRDLSPEEVNIIAEQIQNSAWKFYLLSTSPKKSITFDAKKSIAFEGATGPYLQYAGVRIKSILRKADLEPGFSEDLLKSNPDSYLGDAEKQLGVKILEFGGVIDRAAETKNTTYIVTFLLELAQDWSSYYAQNSVLNAETEDLKKARLALAQKVLSVLEKGLAILGIEVPEVM